MEKEPSERHTHAFLALKKFFDFRFKEEVFFRWRYGNG